MAIMNNRASFYLQADIISNFLQRSDQCKKRGGSFRNENLEFISDFVSRRQADQSAG